MTSEGSDKGALIESVMQLARGIVETGVVASQAIDMRTVEGKKEFIFFKLNNDPRSIPRLLSEILSLKERTCEIAVSLLLKART